MIICGPARVTYPSLSVTAGDYEAVKLCGLTLFNWDPSARSVPRTMSSYALDSQQEKNGVRLNSTYLFNVEVANIEPPPMHIVMGLVEYTHVGGNHKS
ncbi:unnamed protein product [Caenorhabditis auriculariae]|uniref:Uncharacterized protein n=1 Tax=Caenorhabditis auriculariae TaxID=2777116 RepID=A0A8S1GZU8_9PELO|nr:unnamed protein product [Caenorhabditis auriculariae]